MALARRLLAAAGGQGSYTGVPAMASLGWTNVKDYGAVGNGSTDDTTAIAAAISALSTRGVLYFPPGTYKTSGGFTISVPCMVVGMGGGGGETLDYDGGGGTVGHISQITCTSQTANLFTVSATGVQFHDLSLVNTYAGTPSAGAAILTATPHGGDHGQYVGLTIQGFYIGIDNQYGREWMVDGCYFLSPVYDGIRNANQSGNDVNETTITGCHFTQQLYNSNAMVDILRGGGHRITGCLFFGLGPSDATSTQVAVKVALTSAATSNLAIANCHFENYSESGIYVSSAHEFNNITITGNEFTSGRSTANQTIYVNNGNRVVITGNIFLGYGESANAIDLDSTTHAVVTGNYWENYGGFLGGAASSDVNEAHNYGA